jgi:hypothetical protein
VVEPPHHHRVDHWVSRLDPLYRRIEQLQRRHLTGPDQFRLAGRIQPPRLISEVTHRYRRP